LDSKEEELNEWREMFFATIIPDEYKQNGEKTLWPNSWSQEVAMCAFLIYNLRKAIQPKSKEDIDLLHSKINEICSKIYQNGADHDEKSGLKNIEAMKLLLTENTSTIT